MSRLRQYGFRLLMSVCLLLCTLTSFATHQRAGEISYVYVSGLTYEFTFTTYTYTPSLADRPEIEVSWGDGTTSIIPRLSKTSVGNEISKNVYVTQHTFSAVGTFHVTFEDPNRNAGIVNIPSSVEIPFFIETIIVINPFIGGNSSPQLLNPPIDNGCTNVIYYHNPGAYDADGDSLSYSLIPCRGENGDEIPGYAFPYASNSLTIDSITGDLIWNTPTVAGEYNVAILIKEWRNGILISSMVRDMQITIAPCNNQPPEIDVVDTCVVAGDTIQLPVYVSDNTSTQVTLSATGDPLFLQDSPAQFMPITDDVPYMTTFVWNTNCQHVRKNPYVVTFKAKDNGPQVELVSFKRMEIKVVAPKPEIIQAVPNGNVVHIFWHPDVCSNAIGYDIYRRTGSNPFIPDYCEVGMPADEGYQWIGSTSNWADTSFVDDGTTIPIYHANDYCYRVVAIFPDDAESYVSDEVCTHIALDAPLVINTDVLTTDSVYGTIKVRWIRPFEVDSQAFPPPYYYNLYRKSRFDGNFVQINGNPMVATSDTIEFLDHDLNTLEKDYTYYVTFCNTDTIIENSDQSTSIYLQGVPSDRRVNLSWHVQQPWNNVDYVVFRYNGHQWDSIGTTTGTNFTDVGLENGQTYCYFVQARGFYWLPDTIGPLWNKSQSCCVSPLDDTPPEMPELTISTDCISVIYKWRFSSDTAESDARYYYFYYKPTMDGTFVCIDSLQSDGNNCFPSPCEYSLPNDGVIVGCFAMTVADSNRNVTPMSDTTCFDIFNCLDYHFPNVFTPNGDGVNDLFTPFMPYSGVVKVDMQIFNRWGRRVFKTEDPDVKWDGTSMELNGVCADGVYFYSCEVYVNTLSGMHSYPLHGSITLIR